MLLHLETSVRPSVRLSRSLFFLSSPFQQSFFTFYNETFPFSEALSGGKMKPEKEKKEEVLNFCFFSFLPPSL